MEDNRYPARDIIRWLWRAWRGNRLQAVLNATLGLLGVGVSLAQVWAVQHAIDVASHTIEGSLYIAVALMGGLVLCDFAINVSAIWVRNILGIRAQNRMQQSMLDRILRSEWHGRERFHSGDVINRLEGDVNNVVVFLRRDQAGNELLCAVNFSPNDYENYRVGVPPRKRYVPAFTTDALEFGGSGFADTKPLTVKDTPSHGKEQSVTLRLPAFGAVFLRGEGSFTKRGSATKVKKVKNRKRS